MTFSPSSSSSDGNLIRFNDRLNIIEGVNVASRGKYFAKNELVISSKTLFFLFFFFYNKTSRKKISKRDARRKDSRQIRPVFPLEFPKSFYSSPLSLSISLTPSSAICSSPSENLSHPHVVREACARRDIA